MLWNEITKYPSTMHLEGSRLQPCADCMAGRHKLVKRGQVGAQEKQYVRKPQNHNPNRANS